MGVQVEGPALEDLARVLLGVACFGRKIRAGN